jgi:hypothetical protein
VALHRAGERLAGKQDREFPFRSIGMQLSHAFSPIWSLGLSYLHRRCDSDVPSDGVDGIRPRSSFDENPMALCLSAAFPLCCPEAQGHRGRAGQPTAGAGPGCSRTAGWSVRERSRMNRRPARRKTLSMILSMMLIGWSDVWAVSKQVFPRLDARDLPFYLDKHDQVWDQNLYVFSTLSLLSVRKDSVVFDVSKYSVNDAIPLLVFDIYPESTIGVQSEFFDFTIWGQLGNYFNKTIEVIKIENEILSILDEIEKLNMSYKKLMELIKPYSLKKEKIITIDKMNFVFFKKRDAIESAQEETAGSQQPKNTRETKTVDDLIRRYESEFQQERLKAGVHSPMAQPGMLEAGAFEATYVRPTQGARALEAAGPAVDSVIFRLFTAVKAILRYMQENHIEAVIYLSLALVVGAFIRVLMVR